jgi:hypothetical protein
MIMQSDQNILKLYRPQIKSLVQFGGSTKHAGGWKILIGERCGDVVIQSLTANIGQFGSI